MQILLDLVYGGKAPRVRQTWTTICYFCLQSSNFPPDESLIAAKQWQQLLRQELTASSPSLHLSPRSSCMLNGCFKPKSSSLHIKTKYAFFVLSFKLQQMKEVSGSKWREEESKRVEEWRTPQGVFTVPNRYSFSSTICQDLLGAFSFSVFIPSPRFYHPTASMAWATKCYLETE